MYTDNPGHMINMAATNYKKIFFRTKRPMSLKLGMKHWGIGLCNVCINHGTGMTLTYFTARSTKFVYAFEW